MIFPRCTYRIATSLFLWPVCAMMSARPAPPRAALVAKPLRRLCPATFEGSMPTRFAARLTISATARPVSRSPVIVPWSMRVKSGAVSGA
jgi:hypothetical protein